MKIYIIDNNIYSKNLDYKRKKSMINSTIKFKLIEMI